MSIKILSLVPTRDLKGGGEQSFFEVLRFMQEHGYENYVIVPKDSSNDFLRALHDSNIKYLFGQFNAAGLHGDRSLTELKEAIDIVKVVQDVRPDIFITNLYIEPSQWAAALQNIPHIYFDRGQLGLLDNRGSLPDRVPDFIGYANAILCNSKNGKDILKNKYNTESHLVYSYVNKPKVDLKKSGKPRIIVPANFFREKNHLDILAAIARLKKQNAKFDTKVIFMGSKVNNSNDGYYNEILDFIKSYNLGDIVQVISHQKNPWIFFAQNDIYINSGEGEAVGRATIEAEMLGITALIADIPGHWEHKAIFDNHLTFKLHDIDDLANNIGALLDKSKREEVKEHNSKVQKNVLQWMTRENTMGGILDVIEKIKNQDNPAKKWVYDDVLKVIGDASLNYEHLQATINHLSEATSELELLRKPGVRLAARKFAGAVRRQFLKNINDKTNR